MHYLRYIAIAALAYYVVLITMIPVLDWFVLHPSTEPIPAGKAIRQTVPFEKGDLEIWVSRTARAITSDPDLYILCFDGNAGRAESRVETDLFPDKSLEVWAVNYPGFGGSTGPARLNRVGPAVLTAFDALAKVAGNKPILLVGYSFGTIAALHVAAHRPVAGLILQDAPALRQIVLDHGWWNLWLLAGPLSLKVPAALDSVANAKAVHAPALFVLDELDRAVPPKYQRLVIEAYAGRKQVISVPGSHHVSPFTTSVLSQLQNWTDQLLISQPVEQSRG